MTSTRRVAGTNSGDPPLLLIKSPCELHVWDGVWHSFCSDPDMPESHEAYAVMVSFFDRTLGR